MTQPFFSIVMAAYNAAEWIDAALSSVVSQSFDDWEVVVVDDGSSDPTADIVARYAARDRRFRLFRLDENSGAAFKPRSLAVKKSSGRFVVMLDADDFIESHFLEKLHTAAMSAAGVDMVLGRMVWTGSGPGRQLPLPEVDTSHTRQGRELVKYTLDGWKISTSGAVEASFYRHTLDMMAAEANTLDADELLTRHLLVNARKVAFCDAVYNYRQTPHSTTRSVTPKSFDRLSTAVKLKRLIHSAYSPDDPESLIIESHLFHQLWGMMLIYTCNLTTLSPHRPTIFKLFESVRQEINFIKLNGRESRLKLAALRLGIKPALFMITLNGKLKGRK